MAASAVCFGASIPLSAWALARANAPYTLVALRFFAGGLVLLPAALRRRSAPRELRAVAACTAPLLAGYVMLTVALTKTTSTTAAFLSYLLVVIVPAMTAVVYRRLPSPALLIGIVLCVAGLERLTGGLDAFGGGEALSLGAAFVFAIHVIVLGRVASAGAVDVVRLTAFQLLAVGVAAAPAALAVDGLAHGAAFWAAGLAVAGAGLLGLLLQSLGQRLIGPSRTALILMVDPVVAAAGGYWLGERVGWRGVAGAALILAGIATTEVLTLDRRVNDQRR